MTKEVIKLSDIELQLSKSVITDKEVIQIKLNQFNDLKKIAFDFSTKEGIKEAKNLKKEANAWVKDLKAFCDPLEAEGKSIADNRSLLTKTLVSGKENIIDDILAPVKEREDKLKAIKDKLFIPSLDAESNNKKIEELEELKEYNWLAFKDEALELIERQKTFLAGERVKFIEEAKAKKEAEEKAQKERDDAIRLEAEIKAKKALEEREKQIEQQRIRDEQEKLDAIRRAEESERLRIEQEKVAEERRSSAEKKAKEDAELAAKEAIKQEQERVKRLKLKEEKEAQEKLANENHCKKINNEILEDLSKIHSGNIEEAKAIVTAIAKGNIRHLTINY